MAEQPKMQYVNLGNTGLLVSKISFGNWLNSDDSDKMERMKILVKKAWDLGINFFDTAEMYGSGEGERQFAVALKSLGVDRHQYVLSTKIFHGPNRATDPNDKGLSRKHIIEGLKNCLARLEHSYVDIVFAHRFDEEVGLEETCRAFDWVIKQGLANYWGTSEWTAANIFEAMMYCKQHGLALPVADQCQYNMLVREKVDKDYYRLTDKYNYGTTVWSPMAGGILTGKYNDGVPEDSRYKVFEALPFIKAGVQNLSKLTDKLKKLSEIAQRLKITQAQLALTWVLKSSGVSTAIVGASRPEQLEDTVKAWTLVDLITPEISEEIETILDNRPQPHTNYRTMQPLPHRR